MTLSLPHITINPGIAPSSLRILSSNVHGFRTSVGELTHVVLRNTADIVVAVATFLNETYIVMCDKIPDSLGEEG